MTQTIQREEDSAVSTRELRPHPHYTLGTLVALGVVGTLAALGLAVAALMITASRNSVDDELVSERVDGFLAEAELPTQLGADVVGEFIPKAELGVVPAEEANVATAPHMPPPSGRAVPAMVEVSFEIVEGVNVIDPDTGVEFETWGFEVAGAGEAIVAGTPGPVIRTRVGDVLRLTVTNPPSNSHPHNIDLHAVTGQGGGAEATTVAPGETKTIEARMLYPGFYMYHCAYGDVPAHISRGMYGGILVDPAQPLPAVDHEWYMVQSEFYTTGPGAGAVELDRAAITGEDPTYVVFNGAKGALVGENALHMEVGEKSRIYFINAGLNLDSNFHPIGSHWDAVYQEASLLNAPIRGSQTTLVAAGGGTVVDLIGRVPSTIVLVDHALARAFDKGAVGQIVVEGDEQPEIFEEVTTGGSEEPAVDQGGDDSLSEASESVSILPNSFTVQDMDAYDEFSENESPGDYSVNVLNVEVGTTVTWTNDDPGMMHTVTSVDGAFDSGFLDEGDTWSYTFEEPGEYEYFCNPHPWMRARVVVES